MRPLAINNFTFHQMSCFSTFFSGPTQYITHTYTYVVRRYMLVARHCCWCIGFEKILRGQKLRRRRRTTHNWTKTCDDEDDNDDDDENFYFEGNKSKWTPLSRICTTTKNCMAPNILYSFHNWLLSYAPHTRWLVLYSFLSRVFFWSSRPKMTCNLKLCCVRVSVYG